MSVTALIARMIPYAYGWSRPRILKLIEQGQDELRDFDHRDMAFIGTDNKGYPPYLITTATTYRYDLNTAANLSCGAPTVTVGGTAYSVRLMKCRRVFVDVSVSDYDVSRKFLGQAYSYGFRNPYGSDPTRINIAEIPVNKQIALENTGAQVEFIEDPGTSTTTYFVDSTYEAPRLSSESIPLVVPSKYERALELYAIGRIQQYSNSRSNDALKEFYQFWKPDYEMLIGSGASAGSNQTPLLDA